MLEVKKERERNILTRKEREKCKQSKREKCKHAEIEIERDVSRERGREM